MSGTPILAWRLDPLPDLLLDHTLADPSPPGRMREVVSRWIQFVGALWSWRDAASFCLRYQSSSGVTEAWLLARADDPGLQETLREDLEVLLRVHSLERPVRPAPYADPLGEGLTACFTEILQFESLDYWNVPPRLETHESYRDGFAALPASERGKCRVPFAWWAPGGPFLLPMEKLASHGGTGVVSCHLRPTRLREVERTYMSLFARIAQSYSDQQLQSLGAAAAVRRADPTAQLASRLLSANLRRLSDKPYLIAVQCGASTAEGSRTLANSLEAILYEPPFDRLQATEDELPSAAELLALADGPDRARAESLHRELRMPGFDEPLSRLRRLIDARGAATMFRLPINVRGGVPGMAVQQSAPDFHPGPRLSEAGADEVIIGRLERGGIASVPVDEFCKHALITGFTGSGKTRTVLSLLHQLHGLGVPFLVIESAKQEYRGLAMVAGLDRGSRQPLLIFTVGNERCAPFRLNPFELLPGVRVEAHLSRLQSCFEASLPPIGPLVSILGEALIDVYQEAGWRLTDLAPEVGEPLPAPFPSMRRFVARMEEIVQERGYVGETLANVSAAVAGRLRPLLVGSKGLVFRPDEGCEAGSPRPRTIVQSIFDRPTVLELNDLNIDDKALVTMFLLTFLREHREHQARNQAPGRRLRHVTVVEEAHNVLENVQSSGQGEGSGADTRYKTVQAFCSLLTEIRSLGEGLMIADQSPEKLAPDALRNTNVQIAHQLRDAEDRDAIARAMIMDPEQRDFLGKLVPGQAALFVTGLQKATFVRVEEFGREGGRGDGFKPMSDTDVSEWMRETVGRTKAGPFDASCSPCPVRFECPHRKPMSIAIHRDGEAAAFGAAANRYHRGELDAPGCRAVFSEISTHLAVRATGRDDAGSRWCAFVHLWHRDPDLKRRPFPVEAFDDLSSGAPEAMLPDAKRTPPTELMHHAD